MKYLLILLSLLSIRSVGQSVDSQRILDSDSYKHFKNRVNCADTNNLSTSTSEERFCISKEFLRLDSLCVIVFDTFLTTVSQSNKQEQVKVNEKWLEYRRAQCAAICDGSKGNLGMIEYLSCMINITSRRLEFLKKILTNK